MRARNSALVLSLRLNAPSIAEVIVVAPGFWTPRIVMHWWLLSVENGGQISLASDSSLKTDSRCFHDHSNTHRANSLINSHSNLLG